MLTTKPRRIARVLGTVTGLLIGLATPAHAIDLGFRDFQMHGFASQGYTYTSANDFFGNSQGAGSLEFTELGLNVLGHPFPNLLLAVQGIYRDTAGSDEEDFRLDYANVDLSWPVRDNVTLGIRGGRVKNPFGLYNEARDVIWTRPSVLWRCARSSSHRTEGCCTADSPSGTMPSARSSWPRTRVPTRVGRPTSSLVSILWRFAAWTTHPAG
jgi:hypothetical protein